MTPIQLALTLGDPRGIGPEVIEKALSDARVQSLNVEWFIVGPRGTSLAVHESVGEWVPTQSRQRVSHDDMCAEREIALAGRLAGDAVIRAADLALSGDVQGIVTGPLDKAALLAGGHNFAGHTEMLAERAGVPTTMMLASDRLRVVLATTHIALSSVHQSLTHDVIVQTAIRTRIGLQEGFGIAAPRIALCALNPHAGDHGRFGTEDQDLLSPAAIAAGIAGPFPADTVFVRAMRGEFDAVIAPYHDVGMTAIKVASFGHAVNVTLGLPFVRTSPDHGTALDIAGQGIASPESMVAAMQLAVQLVRHRRRVPAED